MERKPLKGSERAVLPGARILRASDPAERLEVTVVVRRRAQPAFAARVARLDSSDQSAVFSSRDEFAKQHGANAADMAAVGAFAKAHGLSVVEEQPARRTLLLSGTVAQFSDAFAVQLHHMEHAEGTYRGRTGVIEVPATLAGIIEAVLGLDNRAQANTHFRVRNRIADVNARGTQAAASYTPTQLASLYGFPDGTGEGQCVAVIELGGGYRPQDLKVYFGGLGVGSPTITAVSVDHGTNTPTGDPNSADGEVMLDVEVVGAIAPKARVVVYFAPNTDAGFLDAVTTAIHDSSNRPSVISISWGGPEARWTAQAMTAMDQAFQEAATLGVTICVASGDNGSSDGISDGGDHVDFPASSPFVLACGGTSLQAGSSIVSEVVWNNGVGNGASGGGASGFFAKPHWQSGLVATKAHGKSLPLSMRGVPDVAADADPATGYIVRVDGTDLVIGGTSAVAPLWAALLARINQIAGKPAGYINPRLYANPQGLRDIVQGSNGDYSAAAGWDACTGLGTPNGVALAGII